MSKVFSSYNSLAQGINAKLKTVQKSGVFLEQHIAQLSELIEQLEVEKAAINDAKTSLMQEKSKSEDFLSKKSSALNDLKRREAKKREEIKKYNQAAKESLNNISFEALPSLKRHESVERLFKFFYVSLYHEEPETFDYAKFVHVALKDQRDVFQRKLAGFSMARLPAAQRDEIKTVKEMSFALNEENESLAVMLEWLDYNYEIYLLLKEQDELSAKIALVPAVEERYNRIVENKTRLLELSERNLSQLDRYIDSLQHLRQRMAAGWEALRERPGQAELYEQASSVFSLVENFHGLPEAQEMKKLGS